jgi:hypothetical protein
MKIALTAVGCAIGLIGAIGQTAYADSPPPPPAPVHNNVCIDPSRIDSTTYPDDHTILFHMFGGPVKIWRNDLPRACPGLTFEKGIAFTIRGGEICSNMQVVYVINRWTPCFLGPFTPYTPPETPPPVAPAPPPH